jgi:hypothetical protein
VRTKQHRPMLPFFPMFSPGEVNEASGCATGTETGKGILFSRKNILMYIEKN